MALAGALRSQENPMREQSRERAQRKPEDGTTGGEDSPATTKLL
jgi:hypothetical protein